MFSVMIQHPALPHMPCLHDGLTWKSLLQSFRRRAHEIFVKLPQSLAILLYC